MRADKEPGTRWRGASAPKAAVARLGGEGARRALLWTVATDDVPHLLPHLRHALLHSPRATPRARALSRLCVQEFPARHASRAPRDCRTEQRCAPASGRLPSPVDVTSFFCALTPSTASCLPAPVCPFRSESQTPAFGPRPIARDLCISLALPVTGNFAAAACCCCCCCASALATSFFPLAPDPGATRNTQHTPALALPAHRASQASTARTRLTDPVLVKTKVSSILDSRPVVRERCAVYPKATR